MTLSKRNKILLTALKILIITASYSYIFWKLQGVDFQQFVAIKENDYIFLIFAFLLMFVNWSIEAFKWRLLLKNIQKINYFESIKIVLSGIVFGLFTPNRIGEIGGRAFFLKKNNRIKGGIAATVGSYAQMLVTLALGLVGAAYLVGFGKIKFQADIPLVLPIFLLILSVLMIVLFFKMQIFISITEYLRFSEKIIEKLKILSEYSKKNLSIVLIISMLRYFIFTIQFYLLLLLFNVHLQIIDAMATIGTTYLLINVLPHLIIADLGIRGSVAIFVIGQLSANVQGILSATVLLWLINVILPAFAGQFFIFKHKITPQK